MSIRRTCVILTMFLGVLQGCDKAAAGSSTRSRPKCLASAAQQKAFGDLAPVGKVKKMKAMLEEDATLVHAVINGKLDERPLHWAAMWGQLDTVKLLLEKGAEIDAPTSSKMTPLHWAAWQGGLEVVKYLVSKRADKNATSVHGESVLNRAINHGQTKVADYLRSIGAKMGTKRQRD